MSYDNELYCPACKATGLNELEEDGSVICECGHIVNEGYNIVGKTINKHGDIIPVYECEYCSKRYTTLEEYKRCGITCNHYEEASLGIL